jgi:ABC-type dipeptide/oligopeptide/nickel transport system permease component
VRQLTVSELGQDYIVTARAKGLDEDTIMRRHVFRNVRPPVVTALTLSIPGLFGGLIITERIFSYYGTGLYFIQALENNDYPAIAALFYLFTVLTVIALYLVDILVAVFDPRVRLEGR